MTINENIIDIFNRELRGNVPVTITFTKVDGSERIMRCTTNPSLIPEDKKPSATGNSRIAPEGMRRVFDTDIQEWRSLYESSITQIQY